jgi:branched-chain amino acid transport system ATP-binding protein
VRTLETPVLSVDRVNKRFGGILALKDLSFEVQAGEVLGLMGPNGAGKTTLLNVIAGTYSPNSGRVTFCGRDITSLPAHKLCHLGIARTYQIPQPFVNLTARQNVVVAARFGRGLGKAPAEKEASEILDIIGLSEKKDVLAKDLSTITLKLLELARVLASNPTLILLDEIAAGSSDRELPRILGLIEEIRKMGKTVVLVEHVMKVMVEAVDRIIVIDKGAKIAEGRPGEVMEDKKVLEAYFG